LLHSSVVMTTKTVRDYLIIFITIVVQVMNEVVVDRGPSPYLTNLEVFCNGRIMTSVQGDGM